MEDRRRHLRHSMDQTRRQTNLSIVRLWHLGELCQMWPYYDHHREWQCVALR